MLERGNSTSHEIGSLNFHRALLKRGTVIFALTPIYCFQLSTWPILADNDNNMYTSKKSYTYMCVYVSVG